MHEVAAAWFREQLAGAPGAGARRLLRDRGLTTETVEQLGMGYAPGAGLRARLVQEGFPEALLFKSGLVMQRENDQPRDRFRNRLMIPICRDSGAIIAFGGRAMEEGQQPKYLNSPETAIYVKGRTLYGLNWGKASMGRLRYAVVVEGYFDWAQAYQGGITQRRGLVWNRLDAGSGPPASPIRREGRAELRSGRRRTGRRRPVVGVDGGGGISGQRGRAAVRGRSR